MRGAPEIMHIRLKTLSLLVSPLLLVLGAAYIQWGMVGRPELSISPIMAPESATEPFGFPAWLRITHYVNFLLLILLIRSGLQILMDHPRLYWNVHCTPGTEWLRVTPIEVPKDRIWTAKDDARHLSPWIGLPGYRHTIGMARHWHFLSVLFWVGNGAVFMLLLLATDQWKRLVPNSWQIVPDAWAVFVHYATFHLPPEPNGFYHYNALQQLTYFGVVFVLAPLAILSGPSMSPALTNRFAWYPKLPANRQVGRSLHFLVMCAFVIFLIGHVSMVAITGFVRNMNHIVIGADDTSMAGVYLGLLGVAVIVAVNALTNWIAWRRPRLLQSVAKVIVTPVMSFLLNHATPRAEFRPEDISPFLWANGKVPTCAEWKTLAADNFKNYRLKVYGLVENPIELSLDELRALDTQTQITLHHCIQGWSGIAAWSGLPVAELIRVVRPRPNAKTVVFYSFGDGVAIHESIEGVHYYDNLSIENALNPQTLLAYEMNFQPLTSLHGAPLRLRAENQLGFKMVKWIQAIEFVENVSGIGKGEGGFAEDYEYFGELANI
jgi:DMSO/TMAO reductase YedYZ molybdopterin-dependent catalytic subunit/thiosulfate reductase cytochrome b subunit